MQRHIAKLYIWSIGAAGSRRTFPHFLGQHWPQHWPFQQDTVLPCDQIIAYCVNRSIEVNYLHLNMNDWFNQEHWQLSVRVFSCPECMAFFNRGTFWHIIQVLHLFYDTLPKYLTFVELFTWLPRQNFATLFTTILIMARGCWMTKFLGISCINNM